MELEEKRLKRIKEEQVRAKLPKLKISKFDGTVIDWVSFDGTVIDWVRFDGTVIDWVRFDGTVIDWVRFDGTVIDWVRFDGTAIDWVRFDGTVIDWVRFDGTVIDWVRLDGTVIDWLKFDGTAIDWVRFDGTVIDLLKFDGTTIDWVRFWQQYEEEVDKCTNYADITKFSYLRELLTDQPKSEIAGFPFNAEVYNKAKEVLKKKYGVTTEIVHAHGNGILDLPTIKISNNLKLVHKCYRSLSISVNSSKTMGKLDYAEILVSETLDKLGPIKSDLIRCDVEWQN